ncbi:hypothetical protein COV81_03565 [Candidatus Peregrinibacteria bacterium CG11_big_fil_rev_8_21_14_0_20_41_10]|nr:MAG: hypothetical protein COV81_03565 [Candidatus Peregrinibacteria bacterium CG11_big_fil_rev_8_21_14_0_20_41_10]PIZ74964.1 MAG: hypothetical protein COY06_03415 [Candidatus Peregrinibacteria bacterium CG_4_10_14_0_2_um_filter_41_8]PJC38458.1 MAG: hypothetical protein CO045_00170 [Candidatus Peregrinibacteria bacterium CG_4_9_14_0_2_um_filter_41_14]
MPLNALSIAIVCVLLTAFVVIGYYTYHTMTVTSRQKTEQAKQQIMESWQTAWQKDWILNDQQPLTLNGKLQNIEFTVSYWIYGLYNALVPTGQVRIFQVDIQVGDKVGQLNIADLTAAVGGQLSLNNSILVWQPKVGFTELPETFAKLVNMIK